MSTAEEMNTAPETAATSTLVYRYGLRTPHGNHDLVFQQLRAAHDYRNRLIEIERKRRAAVRAAEEPLLGTERAALVLAQTMLDDADVAVKKFRAKTRKRDEPEDLRDLLRSARAVQREAARAFRAARARMQPRCPECKKADGPSPCPHVTPSGVALLNAIDSAEEVAKAEIKELRARGTLYWGSYLLVERAAGESFQDLPLYDGDGQPNDPRFVRWTGEGAIAVQLQGGLSPAAAQGGKDTRLRISPPDPRSWDPGHAGRSERDRMSRRAEVSLRVGSDGREPIWSKFGLHMARPLPPDAKIMWAEAHRRRVGPHAEWYLTLTLRLPQSSAVKSAPPTQGGAVAVDVGWRVFGDGDTFELRVAYWSDGAEVTPEIVREVDLRRPGFVLPRRGELRLDTTTLNRLAEPEAIRSQRDVLFDAARARLLGQLEELGEDNRPEWLAEATATLPQWRSQAKLAALTLRWRDWLEEHPADRQPVEILLGWLAHDKHLWAQEARRRDRALRRRREIYRLFSVALARTYDTVVLERFDKRVFARFPKTEEPGQGAAPRSNRVLAALGELCGFTSPGTIDQAAKSRGRVVVRVPAEDTTRTCRTCGAVEDRNAGADVTIRCACGAAWDQDDGAADNLLDRWREQSGSADNVGVARTAKKVSDVGAVAETKWQRAKRKGKEKEDRKKNRS